MCAKVLAGGGAYPVAGPGGRGGTGEGEIDTDEKGTCPVLAAVAQICKSAAHCENALCIHPPLVQQTKQFPSDGH